MISQNFKTFVTELPRTFIGHAAHPLSMLWLLCAIACIVGIVEWVAFNTPLWQVISGVGMIVWIIRTIAGIKGITAWPWEKPKSE